MELPLLEGPSCITLPPFDPADRSMARSFINSPETVVNDYLAGSVRAAHLNVLDGGQSGIKVVINERHNPQNVAVISGA